jgi:O-antigen/teichoic acid export membrane protein
MPALAGVLAVLSVRPLLMAFQNPTLFVLYRRINYRVPFFLDVSQTLIAVPATILLAWWLRNVWALVLGLLVGDVARLVLSHVLCPRAPAPRWDRPAVHELSHFGLSIFVNTLVYGGWYYFDRLVGPRLLTAAEIGLYALAWGLAEALDNLISRGSEVFYSMLSRKVEGPERAAFFRRTARRVALFLIPAIVLAALVAPWAFELLYPPKFHGAAILFGLLTARLIMRATGQLQFMYLMMRGEVILATRAYVVSLAVLAATFVVWVQVLNLHELGLAVSSLVAMTTFTLAQTVQMVRRRDASAWPALVALGWTAVAAAGVLLLYGR